MEEKYSTILIGRAGNGRFNKQINLGPSFLTDINKMSEAIFQTKEEMLLVNRELTSLSWKINSMVTNKILFNLKGLNFKDSDVSIGSVQAHNFVKVIENISEGLYALINDFRSHRESGDPKVFRDHILLLVVIFQKLKNNKFFKKLITEEQQDMIEEEFFDCITLYNISIDDAISKNNWRFAYNMLSAFFGDGYWYEPIDSLPNSYLKSCKLDVESINQITDQRAVVTKIEKNHS